MWATKRVKIIVAMLLSAFLVVAQSYAEQKRFYAFEHFDHNKSLTSQSIVSVSQDKYGFLWFGTEDAGVFRFDGLEFKQYSHDSNDDSSIAPGRVYAILADSHGFIWFATAGSGVSQYNPDTNTFQTFQHNSQHPTSLGNDVVRSFMEDHEGNIWMGTSNGISIFNNQSKQFSHMKVAPDALPKGDVWHLYQDQFKHVWIASYGGGLIEYNPLNQKFKRFLHSASDPRSLAHNIVGAIIEDHEGNIWVGGKGGLNKLDRQTDTFIHFQHDPDNDNSLLENYVWDLQLDKRGFLWVAGFGGGLARFDPITHNVIRHHHDPNQASSLSSNLVFFVFQDKGGVLWAGTSNGGLNKYNLANDQFESYSSDPNSLGQFPITNIISAYQTRDKLIWLGGTDPKGGIASWDPIKNITTHFPYKENHITGIPNGEVYDFVEDQQGFLWFAGGITAVKQLNRKTGEVTRFQHIPENSNSILHDAASSLFIDKQDNLWVCTLGGVTKLNKTRTTFTHYLKGTQCDTLFMDSQDNLWVGTISEGVYWLEGGQTKAINFRHNKANLNSLSGDYITHIFESENTDIWLGTMGSGINLWRPESQDFIHYDKDDGLPDNSISTILEDSLGRLWITTSNGLSVFNTIRKKFTNYFIKDGLLSNAFDNISDATSVKDINGNMYFSNAKGVVKVRPESVRANASPPPVVITNIQIANQAAQLSSSYWHAKSVVLNWEDRMISFSFSVLDFNNPDQNKIMYTLEGFDDHWIEAGSQRRAVYTNLDGGEYIFKVKATNNHGVWTDQPLALQVKVVPPWWESIYAIIAYVVILGLAIRYFIYIKMISKEQELAVISNMNQNLEIQVKERTAHLDRAIEDLNENKKFMVQAEKMLSIGRLVTGIAHEVNTPLGVSITASSAMNEDIDFLNSKMARNELSKQEFKNRLEAMKEFSGLLGDSLDTAAKLINKFKKISIEEVNDKTQPCNVYEYIQDTMKTVEVEYPGRNVHWLVSCDKKLVINSSSYAIYTVLENLINNSIKHGYEINEECEIIIDVNYLNDAKRVKIVVEDKGKGINKVNVSRVFDPFYTSARGNNCTGLGLNIVYTEVTQRLGGTIKCLSHEGTGCQFIVEFPAHRI